MMKNVTILLLFLITAPVAYAQTASAEWVQTIANGAQATNAVVDKAGNIYSAGSGNTDLTFGSTVSPGRGMYLCKNTAAGTPLWMVRAITTSGYNVKQITADSHCNIYIRGTFSDSANFGSLPMLYAQSGDFIVKYDSSGTALWATSIETEGGTADMVVDDSDNLVVAGKYAYGAYFGGAADSFPANNSENGFIVKYANITGSILWKKSLDAGTVVHLALDAHNNIYATGGYYTAFTLDGIAVDPVSVGGHYSFVAKLDAGGHALWAQGFNNIGTAITDANVVGFPLQVVTNGHGGCFISGWTNNAVVIGSTTLSPTTGDVFMARFADDGTLQWVQAVSNNYLYVTGMSADTAGNIFLSLIKQYSNSGISIFGSSTVPAPDTTGNAIVIAAAIDTTGTPLWAVYAIRNNNGSAIHSPPSTLDPSGHIYMTGFCNAGGSIAFSNQTTAMPTSTYANFLAKLSPSLAAVPLTVKKPVASVFPNPASSMATVRFSSAAYDRITVTDAVGKTVYVHAIGKGQQEVAVNVSGYAAGAYFIEVSGRGGNAGAKLMVGK